MQSIKGLNNFLSSPTLPWRPLPLKIFTFVKILMKQIAWEKHKACKKIFYTFLFYHKHCTDNSVVLRSRLGIQPSLVPYTFSERLFLKSIDHNLFSQICCKTRLAGKCEMGTSLHLSVFPLAVLKEYSVPGSNSSIYKIWSS